MDGLVAPGEMAVTVQGLFHIPHDRGTELMVILLKGLLLYPLDLVRAEVLVPE
jgi:hypothetical protein